MTPQKNYIQRRNKSSKRSKSFYDVEVIPTTLDASISNKVKKSEISKAGVYKYITLITVFFVAVLMISNITSTKILDFGPFTFDGGTLLFPLSYIFGDVVTEVYGYKQSRKIIWMGFGALLLMSIMIIIVGLLPASSDRAFQADYQNILGFTPRIVMASLVAFLGGEFSNSYLLAKIKIWMKGKKLRVRTIGSTLVGEGLDTIIFVVVAFYGVFPSEVLRAIILSNYIFKVGIEVLFTPLTYLVTNRLKKAEHEDYYDTKTDFVLDRLKNLF